MKSTRCILSIILGLLAGWLPLGAVTVLKNLQVEYQTNPLGIDVSQPRFNWQMESDRYGACGQAYRLWVADSPEQLAAGRYIYDSGKVLSGESVGVVYQGKALQPSTRYYWKVSVWDESGTEITSTEPAWFETGLLGSGWSGARWIGSSETQLSKYRSHYVIDYDVRVAEGNDKAAFVFGARDADNYVSAELDLNGSGDARFILRHTTDGKTTQDASESLASIIPASDKHKAHHIRLKVTTAQYALKYFVDIEIDGKTLVNSSLTPEEKERKSRGDFWGGKEGAFTVYPYPDGELVYHCRLYAIGFLQPKGQTATFSNLCISEDTWNTLLYNPAETYVEKGEGKLNVWYPGENVSAPMLRKAIKIEKPVKSARLYATARGVYEFSVNGQKVGKDYLNPGWTDYRYRIMYNTYDITDGAMGWMEAGVIVPWQMYQQYGDVRILEQHYASMVAYMDYLERRAVRYVQPFGGFGDWLAIEPTNSMLTNTAYSAYDALIMEQVAKRLGKDADQRRFRTFYENVKRSFNDLFVNEEGRTFAPTVESIFGKDSQVGMWPGTAATEAKIVDTQTSYVVPLQFDLFNEKNKPLAIRHLVENIKKHNYTLTTGFIGTPYLNLVLSDNGYDDVAYKLFEQTAYPSWLYPVLQGATTIWERWNSYTLVNGFGPVDMNSFNHYSYGAIEVWMIAYTLGIQRDEEQPAYKHIILQPRIGGTFSFIRGHYDSAYGRIESGWQIQKKGYIYEATIPANTTATLYLPAKSEKSVRMEKGQEGITPVGLKDGKAVYRLGSGSYWIYVD